MVKLLEDFNDEGLTDEFVESPLNASLDETTMLDECNECHHLIWAWNPLVKIKQCELFFEKLQKWTSVDVENPDVFIKCMMMWLESKVHRDYLDFIYPDHRYLVLYAKIMKFQNPEDKKQNNAFVDIVTGFDGSPCVHEACYIILKWKDSNPECFI